MSNLSAAPNLATLRAFDPEHDGAVTVVIGTSKDSRNTFSFQPESRTFRLKHVLSASLGSVMAVLQLFDRGR